MFIEKKNEEKYSQFLDENAIEEKRSAEGGNKRRKKIIIICAVSGLALASLFSLFFWRQDFKNLIFKDSPQNITEEGGAPVGQDVGLRQFNSLPESSGVENQRVDKYGNIKAEYLSFGNFYKKDDEKLEINIKKFNLPINVKTDVSNYHYVYRIISLDKYIEGLNNDGFVLANNPYVKEADDFYGLYEVLGNRGFPLLMTDDFIIYYYQNEIKRLFKNIEKDVFYENIFEINKKFFDIANERYRKSISVAGVINDSILEGERLEAVFFATSLELLKPSDEQIDKSSSYGDTSLFNSQEAEKFNNILPDNLKRQVEQEVNLIKSANIEAKSPITLQVRDYKIFRVPKEYSSNAKLNNFYLATKWMNTLFPLYFKGPECGECQLDKDDWNINFIAASLIAKDFADNQEFRNQWAKIYKVLSYFSGLRSELTYLFYNDALIELFGKDYKIEEIFSANNKNREDNFNKIQKRISEFEFKDIEGGYDRSDKALRPAIGLRMLSESYWPNDYIFNQLTYPNVKDYYGDNISKLNVTSCKKEQQIARCSGFGKDIINLVYSSKVIDEYYLQNTNYNEYDAQIRKIQNELKEFNINAWYNNSYWSTLRLIKSILSPTTGKPAYAQKIVFEQKDINTSLSSWVDIQLPIDNFEIKQARKYSNFEIPPECNKYNYIEPNIELIRELKANSKMLYDMLSALDILPEVTIAADLYKDLNFNLEGIEAVIKKELSGADLNDDDCKFIDKITNQYQVAASGDKKITLFFHNTNKEKSVSINGVKLMIAVNEYAGEKMLVFGPVFNYQE